MNEGVTAFDLLRACFPAGTVSGAPKVRAMQLISELEGYRRGPYAGAVGYALPGGTFDTCIAIRTIVLRDGVAHLQAGAGIVADSDPAAEHDECLRSSRPSRWQSASRSVLVILLIDNYDSFTYNLAHLFGELGPRSPSGGTTTDADEAERLAHRSSSSPPVPAGPASPGATLEIIAGSRQCPHARGLPRPPGDRRGLRRRGRPGPDPRPRKGRPGAPRRRGLFRGLPEEFEAGRYHSLAATRVPDVLEVSATTADGEVMAVRHRELPIDGVQFHPESILTPLGSDLARNFLEAA